MQDLETIKNKVNLLNYILSDAPQSKVKRSGKATFLSPCPFCNKGVKSPHFAIYESDNSFSSFGCELNGIKGGSIIDYIKARENLNNQEATKRLFEITNTPFEEQKPQLKRETMQIDAPKTSKEDLEKINAFCTKGFSKMQEKDKLKEYLASRNISEEAISKYHLFISKELVNNKSFLVIPIIENGKAKAYIGRNISKGDNFRYKNSNGAMDLFNKQYLKQKASTENELLFICEGVFDAMSIEEVGFKAISLNSTSNVKRLLEAIKENLETAKTYKYIIATDTDESGIKAKDNLRTELTKLDISNSFIEMPYKMNLETNDTIQYNDINEWLINTDKETFKEDLEKSIYSKYASEPTLYYMDDYYRELANYSKQPTKKTGFYFLDEELDGGFKSGLYILGAIPSLRKNYLCFTNSR